MNGHLCGDVVPVPAAGTRLDITYEISDADEPGAEYIIRIFRDSVGGNPAGLVDSFDAERDASGAVRGKIEDLAASGSPEYLFFKLTQFNEDGDEDDVWTAPIWFQNSGPIETASDENSGLESSGEPRPVPTNPELAVASKRSNSFHVSLECLDTQRIKPENIVSGSLVQQGRRIHPGCPSIDGHCARLTLRSASRADHRERLPRQAHLPPSEGRQRAARFTRSDEPGPRSTRPHATA